MVGKTANTNPYTRESYDLEESEVADDEDMHGGGGSSMGKVINIADMLGSGAGSSNLVGIDSLGMLIPIISLSSLSVSLYEFYIISCRFNL